MAFWCALFFIIVVWSCAVVWAAWRARWIVAAFTGFSAVVGVILSAQVIGGRQPVGYGIALGLSIFLTGAMLLLGMIAFAAKRLARRDREP